MNGAHWHLALNHLPIILPLVAIVVLITGLLKGSRSLKETALFIFMIGSLATIAAMNTGEGAEEVVEEISGVTENYIEQHEELAETFAFLSYGLGALSLLTFWFSRKEKKIERLLHIVVLIFSCSVLIYAQKTATSGGEIRHTEIRTGLPLPADAEEREDH